MKKAKKSKKKSKNKEKENHKNTYVSIVVRCYHQHYYDPHQANKSVAAALPPSLSSMMICNEEKNYMLEAAKNSNNKTKYILLLKGFLTDNYYGYNKNKHSNK